VNKVKSTKKIRIGGGSACAEDRVDHAVEMIERGSLDYICFDSLSENELSQVLIHKLSHPEDKGYDLQLEKRMTQVLPAALKHKVKVIGNMGSTNPVAAAEYIAALTKKLGYQGIKIAAVTGDNVRDYLLKSKGILTAEYSLPVNEFGDKLVAANAYIPCTCIEEALKNGADIVLTGRVGDSGLFLGALRYEFGWKSDDWDNLALGIMCGHQLECAAQLSGGYYADPPYKQVPNAHKIGYPIAEVHDNGDVFFTKAEGTGGVVDVDSCKEQIIYEIYDPSDYRHAEVIVNLTGVNFEQIRKDCVKMTGVKGKPAPEKLKVALGVRDGYFTETYAWYGGPGARTRAEYAREMLYARFDYLGYKPDALGIFLMGIDGMYGSAPGVPKNTDPWEVGVRMAVRGQNRQELVYMIAEATANLTNNGPASVSCMNSNYSIRDVVKYFHVFIPRDAINLKITYVEV
jgi:hypothetical protein